MQDNMDGSALNTTCILLVTRISSRLLDHEHIIATIHKNDHKCFEQYGTIEKYSTISKKDINYFVQCTLEDS